MTLETGNAM